LKTQELLDEHHGLQCLDLGDEGWHIDVDDLRKGFEEQVADPRLDLRQLLVTKH